MTQSAGRAAATQARPADSAISHGYKAAHIYDFGSGSGSPGAAADRCAASGGPDADQYPQPNGHSLTHGHANPWGA